MKISAIVPTRNRVPELRTLLESLVAQTRRPDEVVIVDASDRPLTESELAAYLRSYPLRLNYLHTSPGATRQRNLGAGRSIGDLLFFFDDDIEPDSEYIGIMEATFRRHPEYAGGMGTLRPTMRRWSPGSLLCRLFLLQHEHGDGRFGWSGMPRHPYGTQKFIEIEVLGAGLMAVRRAVFANEKIEFDERLLLSQQDVDFSRRLSRSHRLFFNPRAIVKHSLSPRGRPGAFEQGRLYMFNFRYLYFKNFYPHSPWTLPAHWWALVGMFIVAIMTRSLESLRGYAAGLREFARMRSGRSAGLFEPVGEVSSR